MDALHPAQQALADACHDLGFGVVADHNRPASTGLGPWLRNVRDGIRISTAVAYLQPARRRPNLTIRPGCLVERVLFDGRRAVGVEVECGADRQQVRGRRITLSAGALASPLLLLRSGIGPRAELLAHGIAPLVDLAGVGDNLVDHPWAPLILVPKAGVGHPTALPAAVGLRYTTPGSGDFNDMQMYFNTANLARWPTLQAVLDESLVLVRRPALQRPRSRGRLTLTSPDPHSPPAIAVNCLWTR
jgi:choline dehydrogenase